MIIPFLSYADDSEAPEITSGPIPFVITDTAAIINWETDENSDSAIQYDIESRNWGEYTYEKINTAKLVTKHSLTITGLIPDTKYYFRVGSVDMAGNGPDLNSNNTNPSGEHSFETLAVPDTTAPKIFDLHLVDFTEDTTTIGYTTDEPGTTLVQYGLSSGKWNSYENHVSDDELVINHTATLQTVWELVYYFRAGSTDYSGNGPLTSDDDDNPSFEVTLTTSGSPPSDSSSNTSSSGNNNAEEPPEATCFIDSLPHHAPNTAMQNIKCE